MQVQTENIAQCVEAKIYRKYHLYVKRATKHDNSQLQFVYLSSHKKNQRHP